MKLARSTYYYRSRCNRARRDALGKRIAELCAEFPRDGYRRITAQLRAEGLTVNHKAVARAMREQGLQVRPLRRFVLTTKDAHGLYEQFGFGPLSTPERFMDRFVDRPDYS